MSTDLPEIHCVECIQYKYLSNLLVLRSRTCNWVSFSMSEVWSGLLVVSEESFGACPDWLVAANKVWLDLLEESLLVFGNPLELFPSIFIKQSISSGIHSTSHWFFSGNDRKGSMVVSPFSYSIQMFHLDPEYDRSLGMSRPSWPTILQNTQNGSRPVWCDEVSHFASLFPCTDLCWQTSWISRVLVARNDPADHVWLLQQ